MVRQLTTTAAEAGTNELKKFAAYYNTQMSLAFSQSTLQCLYLGRDFNLLIKKYATDFDKMGDTFFNYVGKNFIEVHQSCRKLQDTLNLGLYEEYGQYFNMMLKTYFGSRIDA
jgi:hypothetical protein